MDPDLAGDRGDIAMFDLGIVKIVEVIQNCDLMSFCEQFLDKMRTNESSTAGNEKLHPASVGRKGIAGKRRTPNN